MLAMQRQAKADSDAMKARQEANHKAQKEAEVMARFKASEEERRRVRTCAQTLKGGVGVMCRSGRVLQLPSHCPLT